MDEIGPCGAEGPRLSDALWVARNRAGMCTAAASLLFVLAPLGALQGQANPGRQLFQTACAVCHTIGGGRLVGPDLAGISERRSEAWIIGWVQHSQRMVAAKDPDAVAIFAQFNGLLMPDMPFSDDQIRAMIAYTRESAAAGPAVSAQSSVVEKASEAQVLLGQALFQGNTRLANGGPTCNACHEVTNDAVIGGGMLARDLTTVISRLGEPGVRAILGGPPFPAMQLAFAGRPLTNEEITALVGFFQRTDAEHALHQPRKYGVKMFAAGVTGAVVLLGLCSLLWTRRKKGSVNDAIFTRQVKST